MDLDYLAKRLYPKLPYGRRNYQLKVLLAASCVGMVLAVVLVALMCLRSGLAK